MKKTVKSPRSNLKLSKRKIVPMNELPLDIDTTADVWNDLPQVKSQYRKSDYVYLPCTFLIGIIMGIILVILFK